MKKLLLTLLLGTLSCAPASADIMSFDYEFTGLGGGAAVFTFDEPVSGNDVTGLSTSVSFSGAPMFADLIISTGSNFIDVLFDFNVAPPLGTSFTIELSDFVFPVGETLNSIGFNAGNSTGTPGSLSITGTSSIEFTAPGNDVGVMDDVNYRFDFDTTVVTPVPEPSSFAAFMIGGLAAWRIRRRRSA